MVEDDRPIVRCVCFDKTFEELKALGLATIEEISAETGCGTKCGLCLPYILKMLETGDTRFRID